MNRVALSSSISTTAEVEVGGERGIIFKRNNALLVESDALSTEPGIIS